MRASLHGANTIAGFEIGGKMFSATLKISWGKLGTNCKKFILVLTNQHRHKHKFRIKCRQLLPTSLKFICTNVYKMYDTISEIKRCTSLM